jgi:hypothetical protein
MARITIVLQLVGLTFGQVLKTSRAEPIAIKSDGMWDRRAGLATPLTHLKGSILQCAAIRVAGSPRDEGVTGLAVAILLQRRRSNQGIFHSGASLVLLCHKRG